MSGKKYEQYEHHNEVVWVDSELKGKHREHCLCWNCEKFKPNPNDGTNCEIAQELFEFCQQWHVVTPVYECIFFLEKGAE